MIGAGGRLRIRSFVLLGIALMLILGVVGHSASTNLRVRGCAGPPVEGKPLDGCARITIAGDQIQDITAAGGYLYFVAGQPLTGNYALGHAIEAFRVSSAGVFSRIGCYGRTFVEHRGPTGCTEVPSPDFPPYTPVRLAADAGSLFATSLPTGGGDDAARVDAFTQRSDGSLSWMGCVGNDPAFPGMPCSVLAKGLGKPGRLAMSPDAQRVYTVASYGIWSFDRRRDGSLAVVGCTRHLKLNCKNDGGGPNVVDGDFWPLVVSPDSRFLYAFGTVPRLNVDRSIVSVYARTAGPPGLRFVHSQTLPRFFTEARDVALSRDGRTLYAVAVPGVIGLARDSRSGRVSRIRACLSNYLTHSSEARVPGCRAFPNDAGQSYQIARAPDGALVLTEETGVWLLGGGPSGNGLRVKSCVLRVPASQCRKREKRFRFSPTDATVLKSGQIVVTNGFSLFAMAR
jgi:hypothetical protein